MNTMNEMKIVKSDSSVTFSLETNPGKFKNTLAILYVIVFGYIDLTVILPSFLDGRATLLDVLLVNLMFFGFSLLAILFAPLLLKIVGQYVHKGSDFVVLNKEKKSLYLRIEEVTINTSSIKAIKLEENKNIFGLLYYVQIVTDEMEKRILPQMSFNSATLLKDTLKQELGV